MNEPTTPTLRYPRVWLARAQQTIGWAGLGGLALVAAAALVFGLAWAARSAAAVDRLLPPAEITKESAVSDAGADAVQVAAADLAPLRDVPLLLTQMERIAVTNGLGWIAADYRITPATDSQPSSLEARSNFKGPYPKLRSMLKQILHNVPASTLREFSLSRPSSDSLDVEAKLTIAVLLEDDPVTSGRARAKAVR